MKTPILFAIGLLVLSGSLRAQSDQDSTQPSVALLGMFHFGETSDLAAIKMNDLHTDRRQAEMEDLVQQLQSYQPTKILVEYPLQFRDTLQKQYQLYLEDAYPLGDSETYQLGFRLAKAMGHNQIFAMDHKMDLPFDKLSEHLAGRGEMEKMNAMIAMINSLMQLETLALETMTLSTYLLRLNSERFDQLANSLYLKEVLEMGSEENEVGAQMAATWYHRNMIMLKNITSYIASPQERLLVIVGSSHRAVIKDFVEDRVDLKYVEIADFMN